MARRDQSAQGSAQSGTHSGPQWGIGRSRVCPAWPRDYLPELGMSMPPVRRVICGGQALLSREQGIVVTIREILTVEDCFNASTNAAAVRKIREWCDKTETAASSTQSEPVFQACMELVGEVRALLPPEVSS